jgi:hypothetical protein
MTDCDRSRLQALLGRLRSEALNHACRPSGPRTRPHHSRRSFTHQSSWHAADRISTGQLGLLGYAVGECGSSEIRVGESSCGQDHP